MTDYQCEEYAEEALLEDMRKSRDVAAVLKTRLAQLKSGAPDVPVFAFEGPDDKFVYYAWVGRIDRDLRYEPFICNGKAGVLELRRMVRRDLDDIGRGVYFFVDRDFDDLRGEDASDDLFMTDRYSVENYLVEEDVLDELLKNEFHCHGGAKEREKALELFATMYAEFLAVTRSVNYRLYVARTLRIELTKRLPERVGPLARVTLDSVTSTDASAQDLVQMEREPSAEEYDSCATTFDELHSKDRYRGKFGLFFFNKWLEHLVKDRNSEEPGYFTTLVGEHKANFSLLTLGTLAGKSKMPVGFVEFLGRVTRTEPLPRAA
ncbi:DUF4435 domain-containing protein [Paraburkholderia sp. JPY419]|uniref:DUF4435 domain-containing protein n=1 Tax=Paraburkholderia sp. JPY419 TaxID=667660 RepID=UPI003D1AE5A5